MKPTNPAVSRREFTRRAAFGTAVAVSGGWQMANGETGLNPNEDQQSPGTSKRSAQSQAEAEARYRAILALYPDRFSEAQKTDLKRLCQVIQEPLDALRAYSVSSSDQPALYLKPIVERAKSTNAAPNLKVAPFSASPAQPTADSAKPPAAGKP